jgi:DNA-binding transcriptional regulator PaaX
MQIKLNDEIIFELSEREAQILLHDILPDNLLAEIKRRICWVLETKIQACKHRIIQEYEPVLKQTEEFIPTNEEVLLRTMMSHPSYKDKLAREPERQSEE